MGGAGDAGTVRVQGNFAALCRRTRTFLVASPVNKKVWASVEFAAS